MKNYRRSLFYVAPFVAVFVLVTGFQNCGPQSFSPAETASESSSLQSREPTDSQNTCSVTNASGQVISIAAGDSVTFYAAASVASGQICKAESRVCSSSGEVSGSFIYDSCNVATTCKADQRRINGMCVTYQSADQCTPAHIASYRAAAKSNLDAKLAFTYCNFLSRIPEKAGYDAWRIYIENAGGSWKFAGDFMGSAISWEKCSNPNTNVAPADSNSCLDSDSVAITNLYKVTLKRAPDTAGLEFWRAQFTPSGANFRERAGKMGVLFTQGMEFMNAYGDVY